MDKYQAKTLCCEERTPRGKEGMGGSAPRAGRKRRRDSERDGLEGGEESLKRGGGGGWMVEERRMNSIWMLNHKDVDTSHNKF